MGTDAGAGVFAAYRVRGTSFESLNQGGDRQCGRVGDEQVNVVGFAVEVDLFGVDRSGLSRVAFTVVGMQMRYRYRIEPTPSQQLMLARVFGCCSGGVQRRFAGPG